MFMQEHRLLLCCDESVGNQSGPGLKCWLLVAGILIEWVYRGLEERALLIRICDCVARRYYMYVLQASAVRIIMSVVL